LTSYSNQNADANIMQELSRLNWCI